MSEFNPHFARTTSSSMSMTVRRVLIVLPGEDKLVLQNGRTVQTGFFLSELIIPLRKLLDAGCIITYATTTGAQPPMDPFSDNRAWFGFSKVELDKAKADLESQFSGPLCTPLRLADISERDLAHFDALFIPGGHAPMIELWKNADMGRILMHFHVNNKITAAICHGPSALLSAQSGGMWPYAGYKMTCYSNLEENVNELMFRGRVPFKQASALAEKGAVISNRLPMLSNVVVDRELITGQGPTSVVAFGDELVNALKKRSVPLPPPPPASSSTSARESAARHEVSVA